jgi:hypothetical protein
MISYDTRRPFVRRPAVVAIARTAGIAGVVLALVSASVSAVGAATVPSAGDPAVSAGPAQAARASAWAVQPTPNLLIRDGSLAAVSCPSPTACVAVGSTVNRTGTKVTLAEAWNGRAWSVLSTPNPPGADQSELLSVSCTSAALCTAVGDSFTPGHDVPLAEAWNGTAWSIQQVPTPPGGVGEFRGVSCTSASACVAVGGLSGTAFAGEWNGTSWSVQQVPSPPDAFQTELASVSCASASACTAVGLYYNGTSYQPTLAEAWNGTSWSVQKTPSLKTGGSLNGVSCTSASACTAVGNDGNQFSLAERWNGTAWSIQATPDVRGLHTPLYGVSCPSATLCTAAGGYFNGSGTSAPAAERWNGTKWSLQTVPAPRTTNSVALNGVSCTSASACAAAGRDGAALAEAWNGTSWSIQPITTPPGTLGSALTSVSCPLASACTAVGNYQANAANYSVPFAEAWNGTSWSILRAQNQPGAVDNVLFGVSCTTATACTAVGYYQNQSTYPTQFSLAESWNGTSWSIQPTPDHSTSVSHVLHAVSCTSATACTAVGSQGFDTLAEAWNGSAWTVQPTPHPEQGQHLLLGVSCTSASACTAVGTAYDGTLAESWNGTAWSIQPTPGPRLSAPAASAGVSCPTATACTAVWSTGHRTIAAGWNGTAWALQQTASPAGSSVHLLGSVSCAPGSGCTAVGDYATSTGAPLTLAEARP